MNENLFTLIRTRMPEASRAFIRTPASGTRTYGELVATSGRLANVLIDIGVEPGDRVAVQVDKSAEALMLYLACLRAGAAYLPLNPAYTAAELSYFLSDAEPTLFVCAPDAAVTADAIRKAAGVPHLETLGTGGDGSMMEKSRLAAADFTDVPRGADDLAAILYTSGTTGRSKGAMLSHGNLASNARALMDYWRFDDSDVLLHALPIFHTHGLFVATNVTMMAGGSMILLPRFDIDEIVRWLPEATSMMGVPTFYTRLLARPEFTRELVGHVRLFTSGSAPLSAETHREFSARTGHAILERYGMTETSMNTSNPYDGDRRAGTVGLPLPGIEIRIVDRTTGEPLEEGEVGIIEIRGPNVFSGYWRMPDKTMEEFREDGFFVSGDLGMIDDRGYVSLVGRDTDLVISGGFNVYPAEVENALDALDGIAESAVIGVPHDDFGEAVTAVVATRGADPPTEDDIRANLGRVLAKYKVPSRVMFMDALPRNAMGKIEKKVLREKYRDIWST
ncbi:malonyl-CoA synthase [Actinomycetota bacterium]